MLSTGRSVENIIGYHKKHLLEESMWQQTLLYQHITGFNSFVDILREYIFSCQWAYICFVFGHQRELIKFFEIYWKQKNFSQFSSELTTNHLCSLKGGLALLWSNGSQYSMHRTVMHSSFENISLQVASPWIGYYFNESVFPLQIVEWLQ